MKKIILIPKTIKGRKAFEKHLEGSKKMKLKEKMMFKVAGYKQNVISQEPLIIELEIHNKRFEQPTFIDLIQIEIKKALKKNGAIIDEDYSITVK